MSDVVAVDDDDLFMSECKVLRSLQIDVIIHFFNEPEDACLRLSRGSLGDPSYIFIDINIPKIPGTQCLEMICSNRNYDKSVVVIISTTMSDKDAMKHVSNRADFAVQNR